MVDHLIRWYLLMRPYETLHALFSPTFADNQVLVNQAVDLIVCLFGVPF